MRGRREKGGTAEEERGREEEEEAGGREEEREPGRGNNRSRRKAGRHSNINRPPTPHPANRGWFDPRLAKGKGE